MEDGRPEGTSLRSDQWYQAPGRDGYVHRAWMRRGLPRHAFDGRPHIAIAVAKHQRAVVNHCGSLCRFTREQVDSVFGALADPTRRRVVETLARGGTVTALVSSRYPHGHLHVVVITKEEEERTPHPLMGMSTGELVRRLRETLPPYQQKRLIHVTMPGLDGWDICSRRV